jgi:hypothetical protein
LLDSPYRASLAFLHVDLADLGALDGVSNVEVRAMLFRSSGLAMIAVLAGAVLAAADDGKTTLKYHDGTPEGKQSLGGSGEIIEFMLPSKTAKIGGLKIHGARYGTPQPPPDSFLIYVLNEDRSKVVAVEMAKYALFERDEEKWVTVAFEQPVAVPQHCWVALDCRAGPTKGVYVSYDTSTGGKHSLIGLPGTTTSEPKHGGDWMIEALVTE